MENNSGGAFVTPERDHFMLHWPAIFVASHMARDLWNGRIGTYTATTYSTTRWHDGFKLETTAFQYYPDVLPFLEDDIGASNGNPVIAPEHRRQCLAQQWDEDRNEKLQVELAAVQDKATRLVQTTYRNEGEYQDEIFRVHDRLTSALQSLESDLFPITRAVVKDICTKKGAQPVDEAKQDLLMAHARDCTRPAAEYFRGKIESADFNVSVAMYKAFRLFNPAMDHAATTTDDLLPLKELRYLQNQPEMYDKLVEQLPAYLAACENVTELESGIRMWWQDQYRATTSSDEDEQGVPSEFPQWIEVSLRCKCHHLTSSNVPSA